ncbi:MAG TPA: S8 family serine peptidase [Gemmatimonadales bacterium]
MAFPMIVAAVASAYYFDSRWISLHRRRFAGMVVPDRSLKVMPMRSTTPFGWALLLVAAGIGLPVRATAQARSPQLLARLADSVNAAGGRVIILLKSSNTQARLVAPGGNPLSDTEFGQIQTRLESSQGVAVSQTSRMIGALFARVDATRLAALNADPNVLMMEADRVVYLQSTPRDHRAFPRAPVADAAGSERWRARSQDLPWGISDVTAPGAWALGFRGTGVKVGIMDSGGDATHPDLGYAGGYNAATGGTSPSDWADDIPSCNGHGTHVAGTIAGRDNGVGVVGVAPEASIYAIKVFEDLSGGCGAWISTQITAVNWAADNGIRVINASLGGSWSYSYQLAVDQAAARGTFFVAAAGNDNGGPVEFPAAFPSAIAVASLSSSNTRSGFSDVGPEIEVGAPGENIESTLPGGTYGFKSGTSMATPHVTGTVALLVQQNPNITLAGVRSALQNGALDIDAPGFDQNTGWGLVRALNSLQGGAPPPLTLSLSAGSRNVSVIQGGSAPGDNAGVTLSGTGAGTTAWSASKKKSWTTLTTASGTGSGTLAWNRSATGLAVGTYVDTITVTAPGAASGSPATIYDTLRVTAAVVPVALSVSPGSRNVSVTQGGSAPAGNGAVTLTGTSAPATAWTAAKKKSWTTLTTASGTGSGTVAWNRSATGLGVGVYVDTITVTAPGAASGSPATIYDTLQVTAAVVPVTLSLSAASRNVSVIQGGSAPGDNAGVTLSGTGAGTTAWSATKKKSWTTLTTANGTGSGTLAWNRSATGLAVGTYVDTITVTAPGAASGSPATIYDTLQVTAAAVPVALALVPGSRNVTVQQGGVAPSDNATVTLTGTNAGTTAWTAINHKAWNTLTVTGGTGSGSIGWNRNAAGLAVGTYVDTIRVTAPGAASGSPATLYDTLQVTAAVVPVALAVNPAARSVLVQQGTSAPGDNATVTFTGTNGASTAWTVINHKAWNTLTITSGTGSGTFTWSRNATGLAVGLYVDTIRVIAPGAASGSPATIYDTLRITASVLPVSLAVSPAARTVVVQQGAGAPGDNASVLLSGTGASSTAWSASNKRSWNTLTTAGGTGSGTVGWTRSAAGLAPGVYVDTITVTAPGAASGSPAMIFDTLRITSVPVPVVVAVSPSSRNVAVQQGGTAPGDNATVTLTGTNSASTAWSVTRRQGWTSLVSSSGVGNGTFTWNRSASGLGAGTYVDTFTVSTSGGASAELIDTLRITTAPAPVTLAVSPSSRNVSVQQGNNAGSDNAAVSLSGTGAASAPWSASNRKGWNVLTAGSGVGSGTVSWIRNVGGLAAGTYVDTITVTAPGAASGSPATVYDTVRILARQLAIGLHPGGRRARIFAVGRSSSVTSPAIDSAIVQMDAGSQPGDVWSASTTASRLQLLVATGPLGAPLIWQQAPVTLPVGMYIDTIQVQLQRDASVQGSFVDTLEVVSVSLPDPAVAVEDLFHSNQLTDDQRTVLDLQGNRNGKYDIGDFLAWVDKANIHLTGAVASRLQQFMRKPAPTATRGSGSHGP